MTETEVIASSNRFVEFAEHAPLIRAVMDIELTYRESNIIVRWRALTAQERESVDGIRVVYGKANGAPVILWKKSELLHRDITSYEIEKVQSNTKYVVNLEFITRDNAHVISEKSSEILTPSDVYDFKVKYASCHENLISEFAF